MKLGKTEIFIFASVWSIYSALVYRFWFVTDDAYISFRYARNFALGHGLRYNLGSEPPVEGYSNLLWVLCTVPVEYFGGDPALLMPLISYFFGSLLLFSLFRLLLSDLAMNAIVATSAALLLATFPPFAVWSTGGLETMLYAYLLFSTYKYCHFSKTPYSLSIAAVHGALAALCRPEGIAWVALIFAGRLARNLYRREPAKELCAPLLILVSAFLAHILWRYGYYGDFVPNTVHAKAGVTSATLARGFRYVMEFCLSYPIQFIVMACAVLISYQAWTTFVATAAMIVLGTFAWSIIVGGDFMAMGRFIISSLPLQCLIGAIALQRLYNLKGRLWVISVTAVSLAVSLMSAWNIHIVPREILAAFHFRHNSKNYRTEFEQWKFMQANLNSWKALGRALAEIAKPGDSLVVGAIGAVGYFSGLYIYDRFGLINAEVAKAPVSRKLHSPGHDSRVPASYFISKQPTFLAAEYFQGKSAVEKANKLAAAWRRDISKYPGYALEAHPIGSSSSRNFTGILLVLRRQ